MPSDDDELRDELRESARAEALLSGRPRLVELVAQLCDRILSVLGEVTITNREQRGVTRLVKLGIAVGILLLVSQVVATIVFARAAQDNLRARAQDRAALTHDIGEAKRELAKMVGDVEVAADGAAAAARRAQAEGLVAQAEAAEVRLRLASPRDRLNIQAQAKRKREEAERLREPDD